MQSAMLVWYICAVSYVVVAHRIIVTAPVIFRLWIGSFWTYTGLDLGLGLSIRILPVDRTRHGDSQEDFWSLSSIPSPIICPKH